MPKVKDIIVAVGDAVSKIIHACKCSCKSCCCESECNEKPDITPPASPDPNPEKQDIKDFANPI
jgi:hypothetical protein